MFTSSRKRQGGFSLPPAKCPANHGFGTVASIIAHYLDTQSLLSLRQVCKHYASIGLHHISKLRFYLKSCDETVALNMIRQCPSLKLLELYGFAQLDDDAIGTICRSCPQLQQLVIDVHICSSDEDEIRTEAFPRSAREHLQKLTSDSLNHLSAASFGVHLQHISLPNCAFASSALSEWAQHCNGLQTLKLHGCIGVDDAFVATIGAYCPQLRALDVSLCCVTDTGVQCLPACLRELNLSDTAVSVTALIHIGKHMARLRSLWLDGVNFTDIDRGLKALVGCTKLVELSLADCQHVSDAGLVPLVAKCPRLRVLTLCETATAVGNKTANALARHCAQLEHIRGVAFSDRATLNLVKHCHQLQSLQLAGDVTDKALAHMLQHCPQLRALYIRADNDLTDDGLAVIGRLCSQLRTLTLCECGGVSNEGLLLLGRHCDQLRHLVLHSTASVTCPKGVAIPTLQLLDISHTALTDQSLCAIADTCTGLRSLNISGCYEVNTAGVVHMANVCTRLQTLIMDECQIEDAGFEALATHCSQLSALSFAANNTCTFLALQSLLQHRLPLQLVRFTRYGAHNANVDAVVGQMQRRCLELQWLSVLDERSTQKLLNGGVVKEEDELATAADALEQQESLVQQLDGP
eukprot:TRINITY_DN15169_c0_g1_i1.p1 TRINITY_DN15169_c0_g1~~TRINITY_DN15169_c0_g1_i1.p1  ORF type:complete len:636 (+),score=133.01 TRINITY_DN15169_c0_g1_i1:132-2039(+)